jgi:hypothetical protein
VVENGSNEVFDVFVGDERYAEITFAGQRIREIKFDSRLTNDDGSKKDMINLETPQDEYYVSQGVGKSGQPTYSYFGNLTDAKANEVIENLQPGTQNPDLKKNKARRLWMLSHDNMHMIRGVGNLVVDTNSGSAFSYEDDLSMLEDQGNYPALKDLVDALRDTNFERAFKNDGQPANESESWVSMANSALGLLFGRNPQTKSITSAQK